MRLFKSIILSVIMFSAFSCNVKNNEKEWTEADEIIDGVYIPKDIEDCFFELNKILDDSIKEEFRREEEENIVGVYHMGLGRFLRNHWSLWHDSRLAKYLLEKDLRSADDMSCLVLMSYHRFLNNKDIEIENQIEFLNSQHPPLQKDFPKEGQNIEFFSIFGREDEGAFFIGQDTVTLAYWQYNRVNGWKELTDEEYQSSFKVKFVPPVIEEDKE